MLNKSIDVNGTTFETQTKADIQALKQGIEAFEKIGSILENFVGRVINKRLLTKIKKETGITMYLENYYGNTFKLSFFSDVVLSEPREGFKLAVYPKRFRITYVKLYTDNTGRLINTDSYKEELELYGYDLIELETTLKEERLIPLNERYEYLKKLNNEFCDSLKGFENQVYKVERIY